MQSYVHSAYYVFFFQTVVVPILFWLFLSQEVGTVLPISYLHQQKHNKKYLRNGERKWLLYVRFSTLFTCGSSRQLSSTLHSELICELENCVLQYLCFSPLWYMSKVFDIVWSFSTSNLVRTIYFPKLLHYVREVWGVYNSIHVTLLPHLWK